MLRGMPRVCACVLGLSLIAAVQAAAQQRAITPAEVDVLKRNFAGSDGYLVSTQRQVSQQLEQYQAQSAMGGTVSARDQAVIASLKKLLAHLQLLVKQAQAVRSPLEAKLSSGAPILEQESTAAIKQLQNLGAQAMEDSAKAQQQVNNASAAGESEEPPPPPPPPHQAQQQRPQQRPGAGGSSPGLAHPQRPQQQPTPPPEMSRPPSHKHSAAHPGAASQPAQVAAGHGQSVQPAGGGNNGEDNLEAEEAQWFAQLPKGGITFGEFPPTDPATASAGANPPRMAMEWKVPVTVWVKISGAKAPLPSPAGASGQATIPVSTKMAVYLAQSKDFDIKQDEATPTEQFIPENGTTMWRWTVTPQYTGKQESLQIQANVIYSNAKGVEPQLPVYTVPVDVEVKMGTLVTRLIEKDPDYWVKYGTPGGAGFIFVSGSIAGIWAWWRKRKKGSASGAAEPDDEKPDSGKTEPGKPDEPDFGG